MTQKKGGGWIKDTLKFAKFVLGRIVLQFQPGPAAARPASTDGTDPKIWDHKMDGPIAALKITKLYLKTKICVSLQLLPCRGVRSLTTLTSVAL